MHENRTRSGENRFQCSQLIEGKNAPESGRKNVSCFIKLITKTESPTLTNKRNAGHKPLKP